MKGKSSLLVTRMIGVGIILVVISSALGLSFRSFAVGDLGYTSAFQNPRAKFYGISYNGKQYTPGEVQGASMLQLDSVLRFDPDIWDKDQPNLLGGMTTVYIPQETLTGIPGWVPQEWLSHNAYVTNPQKTFWWNISGKAYKMEQWLLRYYVTLNVEWDGTEKDQTGSWDFDGVYEAYYSNLDVWIELDLEPMWYLAGGGTAYFALAKMQLSESVRYQGWEGEKDVWGNKIYTDRNPLVSVSPESQSEVAYIYYGPWGQEGAQHDSYFYDGKELNPDIFREKVYARLSLNHFGVRTWIPNWWAIGETATRGDSAVFSFDIPVFVIGEWSVQDIQDNPDDFGRFTRIDYTSNPWGSLLGWLSSPATLAWLIPLGLFLVVLFFAPWLLVLLFSLISGGRRR